MEKDFKNALRKWKNVLTGTTHILRREYFSESDVPSQVLFSFIFAYFTKSIHLKCHDAISYVSGWDPE